MSAVASSLKGGLLLGLAALDRLRPARDILPVLNYHAVDDDGAPTSLPAARFREHMDILARRGLETITFREAVAILKRPAPLPRRVVCLTFDDGMETVFTHALPVLRERGFRATIFLTTRAEGRHVSWEHDPAIAPRPLLAPNQVQALHAAGMEIGAHTRTHPHLTELDDAGLREELEGSRADVAELVGEAAATVAYPYGDHDDRVVGAVRAAGFEGACTVRPPGRRMTRDPFRVERLDVSRFSGQGGWLGRLSFLSCLNGVFSDYVRIKASLPIVGGRTFEAKERRRKTALGHEQRRISR